MSTILEQYCSMKGWQGATIHQCNDDARIESKSWIEYMALADCYDLHISVHPDTDMDGRFIAFDHDAQELIMVNGWLFTFESIED